MKRYWKLIALAVFIVGTFGILYLDHALARDELPELELVTVSGDETLAENFVFQGDYRVDPLFQTFKWTQQDGITYLRDVSILEKVDGFYRHPIYERLIEENRGFMRGKESFIDHFYDDEKEIVQVEPSDSHFKIEVMDKESKETKEFSVDIPEQEKMNYIHVYDVQLLNEILYVVTNNYFANTQEFHIYEIDLSNESLVQHYSAVETAANNSMTSLSPYYDISAQPFWVFRIDYIEYNEEQYYEEITDTEIMVHHFATGETEKIELPEKWISAFQEVPDNLVSVGDEQIHFYQIAEDEVAIQSYDVAEKQLGPVQTIPFEENLDINNMFALGDSLYFYATGGDAENNGKLIGVNLEKAAIKYEGEIQIKHTTQNIPDHHIEIYDFYAEE